MPTILGNETAYEKALKGSDRKMLSKGVRKALKAVANAPWTPSTVGFGPAEPMRPAAAEEPVRRFDYLVGRNVLFTPRAAESRAITYQQMRNIADSHSILRTIIEKRKDELKGLEWDIIPAAGYEDTVPSSALKKVKDFLSFPDKENSFDQWIGILAEDLFVVDAPCLYINRSKKGEVLSLEPVDGTTVWMLVNDKGQIPDPPEPAYEQNVKNFPRTWYTKEEMIYRPYNIRSQGLYGFSHVESIILTVNVALRREYQFLSWFRSSNLPAALVQAPADWTPQQIAEWQAGFDNLLAGNLDVRSRLNLVPGGAGQPVIFQPLTFDARFDEWLARVMCARFGISPAPYVSQVNRASAQTMEEASKEESLIPIQQFFKQWFDWVIQSEKFYNEPRVQFIWTETQHYKLQDAQLDDLLLKSGVITLDDVRRNKGLGPYDDDMGSKPLVWTQAGPILLDSIVNKENQAVGRPGDVTENIQKPGFETPQDNVESDKEPKPSEVAASVKPVKAELKDWEKFALARVGKKGRPFEVKAIPVGLSRSIADRLAKCEDQASIKTLFTGEAMKIAYWEGFVRDVESFETKIIHNVRTMFNEQKKEALISFEGGAKSNLFSKSKALVSYSTAVAASMGQSLEKGNKNARALIKPANPHATKQEFPKAISEAAQKWLKTRIEWAAVQVTNETEKMLRDQIAEGFDAGESMSSISDRIRSVFDQCDQVRADRIARTEVIAASSQGAIEGYKDAGLSQIEWYPAMDERECPLCETLAGIHDISEQYTPPAHPQCRCVLLPVV